MVEIITIGRNQREHNEAIYDLHKNIGAQNVRKKTHCFTHRL